MVVSWDADFRFAHNTWTCHVAWGMRGIGRECRVLSV